MLKEPKPINTSNLHEDNKLDEGTESNDTTSKKNPDSVLTLSIDNIENVTIASVEAKPVKNVSAVFRHIDERKIQSDTKDIEDESGNNILQTRRVVTITPIPTVPPVRSTSPNTFSNAGGNGGTLDNIQTLSADSVVRKRHRRRRQGR